MLPTHYSWHFHCFHAPVCSDWQIVIKGPHEEAWRKRPDNSWVAKFGTRAEIVKSPNIITLRGKVSPTGPRAAFHRHYSKPEVLYSVRQAQPCIIKCKKGSVCRRDQEPDIVVEAARSDSGSSSITSTARQHIYRALRALNTVNGLFVYTYRSRMGMISRIDPF